MSHEPTEIVGSSSGLSVQRSALDVERSAERSGATQGPPLCPPNTPPFTASLCLTAAGAPRTPHAPKPRYLSHDASRWCRDLLAHLEPWLAAALSGEKRHRLSSAQSRLIAREHSELVCDLAQALAASPEWDGALLAAQLHARGWPVDLELALRLHAWSSHLLDRIMAHHRAKLNSF